MAGGATTVYLTDDLKDAARKAIKQATDEGLYTNMSHYISALLRSDLKQKGLLK